MTSLGFFFLGVANVSDCVNLHEGEKFMCTITFTYQIELEGSKGPIVVFGRNDVSPMHLLDEEKDQSQNPCTIRF